MMWDKNDFTWPWLIGASAVLELIAMALYYIGEGVNYLIFDRSVPAQATTQPGPMP